MTVSTQVSRNEYTGNGATTQYDFTFRILDKSHLLVQLLDASENIMTLTLGTDYTVTGVNRYNGGKVVLTSALPTGYKISIERSTPVTQETSIRNQGGFFPEIHEDAFDKLTMLVQQAYGWWSGLSLRKPSWLANYYDALNNRIRNLRDPSQAQDAATKSYVDVSLQQEKDERETAQKKFLRVPEGFVEEIYPLDARKDSIFGWDSSGRPVPIFAMTETADLALKLASNTPGLGASLIGLSQGGKVQDAIFHITPGMFGYTPDFNITSQAGTDNGPALRQAIAKAIALGYQIVEIPAGFALIDVSLEDVNLGGQGFKGYQGVKLVGAGQRNTRLFFRGPAGSVGISNIGGSGSISQKSLHGIGLSTTNDSVRNVNLYLLDGCCFSHNSDLWLLNGASGIKFSNSGTSGSFTEFNTFTNSRVQNCADNIIFEVNGGDNSFHGNSFTNVQSQVLAGSTFGNGVRVNGITSPAYLYNQTWDMKFFGGANCRAFKLTNCNTDNISGNLTFEGNIICETTDSSFFEFKGNLSGISSLSFIVAEPTSVRAANFVFNNTLDNFSSFTNASLSSYSPRLFNPELADTSDNGVTASLWRVRNSTGDGLLFNIFNGSPGWIFSSTSLNQRVQGATPKYALGTDGNSFTGYSTTVYFNPSNSTYGVQLSSDNSRFAPRNDAVMSCGSGGFRWTQLFAVNSTIGTSDKRKKTNLRAINDAETEAFYEIAMLDSVWQWIDKFQVEGDNARLHSGPTVQDAISIMDRYGLDWSLYSCFVHTKLEATPAVIESWDDEYITIPAENEILEDDGITVRQEATKERRELIRASGSRVVTDAQPSVDEYAFRKEELLFWISRATIAKQQNIEKRLADVESRLPH